MKYFFYAPLAPSKLLRSKNRSFPKLHFFRIFAHCVLQYIENHQQRSQWPKIVFDFLSVSNKHYMLKIKMQNKIVLAGRMEVVSGTSGRIQRGFHAFWQRWRRSYHLSGTNYGDEKSWTETCKWAISQIYFFSNSSLFFKVIMIFFFILSFNFYYCFDNFLCLFGVVYFKTT